MQPASKPAQPMMMMPNAGFNNRGGFNSQGQGGWSGANNGSK